MLRKLLSIVVLGAIFSVLVLGIWFIKDAIGGDDRYPIFKIEGYVKVVDGKITFIADELKIQVSQRSITSCCPQQITVKLTTEQNKGLLEVLRGE